MEEPDDVIEQLTADLQQSWADVSTLQTRMEAAEINSRLPCLILSGAALAPHRQPCLEPPLPAARTAPAAADQIRLTVPVAQGQGRRAVTSQSADHRHDSALGQSAPSARGVRGRSCTRVSEWEEREDVYALVISVLNRFMPGLDITASDIDCAHRLPGPNQRVIVRFVRSGEGSVRDRLMARRLELRGRELFVNESLTKLRGQIF